MTSHLSKIITGFVALASAALLSAATVGQPAPAFTLTDINGQTHSLSDFKGKVVVLEWFNSGCPFVVKFYRNGDLPRIQREFTDKGVVWLAINSTNPSHPNFRDNAASLGIWNEWSMAATAKLLDPDGTVGRSYDARTTPHMFIIDADGILVYKGAIDSVSSTNTADIARAENYVVRALNEILDGKPVSLPTTRPYGCSIKY
jgi:peroxiredoxin